MKNPACAAVKREAEEDWGCRGVALANLSLSEFWSGFGREPDACQRPVPPIPDAIDPKLTSPGLSISTADRFIR